MKSRDHGLKSKFFLKLYIIYAIILIIALMIILVLGIFYFNQKNLSDAKTDNFKTVKSMQSYFQEKVFTSKRILTQLYTYSYYSDILDLLDNKVDPLSKDMPTYMRKLNDYLQMSLSLDNDIDSMTVADTKADKLYISDRGGAVLADIRSSVRRQLSQGTDTFKQYGPNLLPMYIEDNTKYNRYKIPIVFRVKSTNMTNNLGFVLISFNSLNLDNLLAQEHPADNGAQYIIMSGDGTVIYDSRQQFQGKKYEFFEKIRATGTRQLNTGRPMLLESMFDSDLDLYYVGLVPMANIYANSSPQRWMMAGIFLACVVLASVVTFFLTTLFSRRITEIMGAISQIRSGNLKIRIKKGRTNDEISEISENLNEMCLKLEEYINRVYISEIKEKEYELKYKDAALKQRTSDLYALQAQINPHFLYNTLESIRMRAVTLSSPDVARMIYILSTLFKKNIKEGMVTTIEEELGNCRLYLELMKMRYNDTLNIVVNADPDAMKCGLIRHILQPIIENSVQHGIEPDKFGDTIHIAVEALGKMLRIRVEDNGRGIPDDRLLEIQSGLETNEITSADKIGILNVNHRIKLIYGEEYGIRITSALNEGTQTLIEIPAMTMKELENHVQRIDR